MAEEILTIDGLDDLQESLETLVKKYPDRAGDFLVEQAKELRKDVVKYVKNDTDFNASAKRSLSKLKEYKISKVQGIGEAQFVEVTGIAPHFHLIENGHKSVVQKTHTFKHKDGTRTTINLEKAGQSRGFVVGYHFMDRSGKKRQIEIPRELVGVVDKLLREEGLI